MNSDTKIFAPAAAKPDTKPITGTWTLTVGKDGLQGAVDAVRQAVNALETIPPHAKSAIQEAITDNLAETDHNFVTIHMANHRHDGTGFRRDIGHYDIQSSKKLL